MGSGDVSERKIETGEDKRQLVMTQPLGESVPMW